MAKKGKTKDKEEKQEEVLSKEELEKLAKAIKESELEENIEKSENIIQENRFQEFFQPESSSPTLEKIQETPEQINLEQVAATQPLLEEPKEKEDFGYAEIPKQKDEPKYTSAESIDYTKIEDIASKDATKMRVDPLERPEAHFTPSQERDFGSVKPEKYESVERFEMQKAGKQDLFERKEVKYKASR